MGYNNNIRSIYNYQNDYTEKKINNIYFYYNYRNHKKHGICTEYDKNGKIESFKN